MTAIDKAVDASSGLRIQYTGADPSVTVTGVYIFNLTSNPSDCTTSTLLDSEGNPYGILWAPKTTIAQNGISTIGANYFYNMMMRFLYGAFVEGQTGGERYTPGDADGNDSWCVWLGVTNQTVGTSSLTSSNGNLESSNILVQYVLGDAPVSFTNVVCNDSTRLCSTADSIQPQPFPHQRP